MKKFVSCLLIILSLFMSSKVYALSSSQFSTTFDMDSTINDNQVVLKFGFNGEEAYKVSQYVTIDTSKFTFVDAVPIDDFKVSYNIISTKGKNVTYQIISESGYIYSSSQYMEVILSLNSNFKTKQSSEIKISDIYAYSDDGNKYRDDGYYLTLKKTSSNEVEASRVNITKSEETLRFIYSIIPYVIMVIILVAGVVVGILVIPPKIQEDRRLKIDKQLDPKYYPIEGVQPITNVRTSNEEPKKKGKHLRLDPFKDNKAKVKEVTNEKLNKIEIDRDMFKNNPTKLNDNKNDTDDGIEEIDDE
ncbi:MAG TPA: hypothetical protein PLB45_04200 [Bacilli bacterium]|nr:hypothetical protein [Bacilli bacterium]